MTKLYYNSSKVNNDLLPQLLEVKKKLQEILRELNYLNIPYGFAYRNYLINLQSKINKHIDKIKSMENRIDYSNKEFLKVIDDFNYNFSQIEKNDFKVRESIIR